MLRASPILTCDYEPPEHAQRTQARRDLRHAALAYATLRQGACLPTVISAGYWPAILSPLQRHAQHIALMRRVLFHRLFDERLPTLLSTQLGQAAISASAPCFYSYFINKRVGVIPRAMMPPIVFGRFSPLFRLCYYSL